MAMSDLYVVCLRASEQCTDVPAGLSDPRRSAELADYLGELGLDVPDEPLGPGTFVAALCAWGRAQRDLPGATSKGPRFCATLAQLRGDPRTVDPRNLPFVGATWLANQAYHALDPRTYPAISAQLVTLEALTIHADAGLPARSGLNAWALRQLTQASERRYDASPMYRHFGDRDEWAQGDFAGKEDDVDGMVPFVEVVAQREIEFKPSFFAEHAGAWWIDHARRISGPSDNLPYAVGTYRVLTFPAWVPDLRPIGALFYTR